MNASNTCLRKVISLIHFDLKNIDIFVFLFFLSGGLLVLYLSYIKGLGQYGFGFAFVFGSIIYYLSKDQLNEETNYLRNLSPENKHTIVLALNVTFFTALFLSNYILFKINYIRPPVYFVLISICFFSIFLEIFHINLKRYVPYLLSQIFIVSLSFRWGRYYSYPTIPGSDTHFHLNLAKYISLHGKIPTFDIIIFNKEIAGKYASTPLWHLLEAIGSIILNLPLKENMYFTVIGPFVIIFSLLMFLLVRRLFNTNVALISVILVNIADMIYSKTVTNVYTSSIVYIYLFLALYSFTKYKSNFIFSLFVVISIICMIYTHQLSTFCVFIIFISLSFGKRIFTLLEKNYKKKKLVSFSLGNSLENTTIFFFVLMIFQWLQSSEGGSSFFDKMVFRLNGTLNSMLAEYFSETDLVSSRYEILFSNYDILSNVLYNLGYSILLFFAVIGILYILRKKIKLEILFPYICATFTLFGVIYLATYIGLDSLLLPHRFLPFLEFFLIIFASFSIYKLYMLSSTKLRKIGFLFIVISLIFFMITTPYINSNDPFYCKERVYRTENTYAELSNIEWCSLHINNTLFVDDYMAPRTLSTVESFNTKINVDSYPKTLKDSNVEYLYLREYIKGFSIIRDTGSFGTFSIKNYSLIFDELKEYNLIYSSNSGEIYAK